MLQIRDVIHGTISVQPHELPIIDSHYFQRLRQIKQVGFSENSFPCATHHRFIHSLGAMEVATQVFDSIFGSEIQKSNLSRFRYLLRLAALLHDIGHGPLSHTTEFAMPSVDLLKLPNSVPLAGLQNPQNGGRSPDLRDSVPPVKQATHEDYTLKMILDSGLTPILEAAGKNWGLRPLHIASLIDPRIETSDRFFYEKVDWGGSPEWICFKPILAQIISSELDADRMDYLQRDSHHTGVSYGQFDSRWILSSLTYFCKKGCCYLALQHRALYAFEDFLLSRYHMFLMVYFHHKSVIYDEMLASYFSSPDCTYHLPADIEDYCLYNDAHLMTHLSQSQNKWAQRITQRRPYRLLIELHSGIPATKTTRAAQAQLLEEVKTDLSKNKMHYLATQTTGELSKYFRKPGIPIFVRYDNHYNTPTFIPLEQCTDLFEKYEQKRSITRLYISPENYSKLQPLQRKSPPNYEEADSL